MMALGRSQPILSEGTPVRRPNRVHPLAQALLRKMLLAYLAFALALSAILGLLEYRKVHREVRETLESLAVTFAPAAESALWDFQFPVVEALVNGIGANPSVVSAEIRGPKGEVLASWKTHPLHHVSGDLVVTRGLYRVQQDGQRRLLGTMIIASDLSVAKDRLARTMIQVGSFALSLLLVMMLLLWVLTRILVVRRLEQMASYASSLDPEALELSAAPDLSGPNDELTDMTRTLNDLRLRLIDHIQQLRVAEGAISDMNTSLLRAVAHAESANQAKNHFLRKMSHEFLTPLNHVQLHAELIESELGESGSEIRNDLNRIRQAARGLAEQIVDILDLVDLESTRAKPCCLPIDVSAMADTLRTRALPWAQANGNILTLDLMGLPASPKGDADMLVQALSKLLHNACRFTQGGRVALSVTPHSEGAVFEVRDTGQGIVPEDLDRIFEVFSQGEEGLTRAYGGFGLGLAICQHLVRSMGGHMSVESKAGEGSVFRIHLPMA